VSEKMKGAAASIRQRLYNLSRERGLDFQYILIRYGLERLLYRLGNSAYAGRFVLKGAMLFAVWSNEVYRPTRDLDLLGYGDDSAEEIKALFQEICRVEVEADGIVFDPGSINVEEIRGEQEYQGKRVKLIGVLKKARIPLQIDVGFGDVVTPEIKEIEYPTLLALPSPRIRAYPEETMVSEKLQAIVSLGMVNSRMKDFYDLWVMSRLFCFDGEDLATAIQATFNRRRTVTPEKVPLIFKPEFTMDRNKTTQWRAFLNRTGLVDNGKGFVRVIEEISVFLLPPLLAAGNGHPFQKAWIPGKKWQAK